MLIEPTPAGLHCAPGGFHIDLAADKTPREADTLETLTKLI